MGLKKHEETIHEKRTFDKVNSVDPVFIETSDISLKDTEIKKEEITDEVLIDPLADVDPGFIGKHE